MMELIEFKKIISESKSFSEVSRKMYGNNYYGNRQTIKKRIEEFYIDISHFDFKPTGSEYYKRFIKTPLSEILVLGSTYGSTKLKNRLYDEGLKERICEKCGQNEWWQGEKLSLILDHINGDNTDNRLNNLRILCPNCNATLKTHGGRNAKLKSKSKKKQYIPLSSNELNKRNIERSNRSRTVKRPPREQLLKEIEESNYSAVGRKYGVSDNAVRKWVRFYEKYKVA